MHCQVAKQPEKGKVLAEMNVEMETRLTLGFRTIETKEFTAIPETEIALILDSIVAVGKTIDWDSPADLALSADINTSLGAAKLRRLTLGIALPDMPAACNLPDLA